MEYSVWNVIFERGSGLTGDLPNREHISRAARDLPTTPIKRSPYLL